MSLWIGFPRFRTRNLGRRKEDVWAFAEDNEEGRHFMLGGRPRDFTVKEKWGPAESPGPALPVFLI